MAFGFIISLESCQKESLVQDDADLPLVDLPLNQNGILKFRSMGHIQSFYLALQDYAYYTDGIDSDSAFFNFESALGHKSIRSIVEREPHIDFQSRSSGGANPAFLLDNVRESILNEHHEVIIGDSLYIYASENKVYQIATADMSQAMEHRVKPKGGELDFDFRLLNSGAQLKSKKFKYYPIITQLPDCELDMGAGASAVSCVPNTVDICVGGEFLYTPSNANSAQWVPLTNGTISIDWGQSGAMDSQVISNVQIGESFCFQHMYAEPGEYTFTVTYSTLVSPCGSPVTATETGQIIASPNNCAGPNRSKSKNDIRPNDTKLRSQLWFKHDIFGNHQVAETTCYKWKKLTPWGSYDFYRHKRTITATINYYQRNSVCETLPNCCGSETDVRHQKDVRAAKTWTFFGPGKIGNEEVSSYHKINTKNMERDQVLDGICQ